MTVQTVSPRIVSICSNISGIETAVDPPPPIIDTAKIPCLFVFTGEAEYKWDGDIGEERRTYRVQVAVVPTTLATPETRETRIRPLIDAVVNQLASYPGLNNLSRILNSEVMSDSGPAILPEYEGKYVGFEIRLVVTSIVARNYAAKE
jgi:hypothetical protein